MTQAHESQNWRKSTGKWIVFGLFAFGIAAFFYFDLARFVTLASLNENKEALKTYTESHYLFTVILYILLYFLQTTLSLPGAAIFTLAGGFLFGTLLGTLYVNISATAGATLAFLAARYLFRETIEYKFGKRLQSFHEGINENALSFLLTLRLIPLFPFFLVNLAAGLTRIRLTTYLLATSIGIIPGSLVFSNAGKQLGKIHSVRDITSPNVLGALTLLGLMAIAPVVYHRFRKPTDAKL